MLVIAARRRSRPPLRRQRAIGTESVDTSGEKTAWVCSTPICPPPATARNGDDSDQRDEDRSGWDSSSHRGLFDKDVALGDNDPGRLVEDVAGIRDGRFRSPVSFPHFNAGHSQTGAELLVKQC